MLNVNPLLKVTLAALAATLAVSNSAYATDLAVPTSTIVPNLETMLLNFAQSVPNLMRLVTAASYVMGMFLVIAAVIGFRHFGELRTMMAREHGVMAPLTELLVGAALLYLPTSVQTGLNTFWKSTNPYAYINDDNGGNSVFITAAYSVIQLIGTIAFIRGLMTLKAAGSEKGAQPGILGKAMAHLVGGVLCINIYNTIAVFEKTIGLVV